jgi:hypothetical protein
MLTSGGKFLRFSGKPLTFGKEMSGYETNQNRNLYVFFLFSKVIGSYERCVCVWVLWREREGADKRKEEFMVVFRF